MIFQFTEPRAYLRNYLRQLPKRGYGEARKIAAHLGVSSTYMSLVFAGSKSLTLEQTTSLSRYLGHNELESEYFFFLVEKERAGTKELSDYCARKLEALRKRSLKLANRVRADRSLNAQEQSVFYSSPIFSMVHLYCSTQPTGRTIEEIAKRFEITRAKTAEVVDFLVQTALCARNGDRFTMTTQGTHLPSGSPHLSRHHANWRLKAIQAADTLANEELMYTVNVTLSKKDFALIREELVALIKRTLETVYPSPAEELATLDIDWFWVRK